MGEGPPDWGHHRHGAEPDTSASAQPIFGCFFLPPHSKILAVPPGLGILHPQVPPLHLISPPDPGRAGGHRGGPEGPLGEEGGTCHREAPSRLIAVQGNRSGCFPPGAPTADVPGDHGGFTPPMSPEHSPGCPHLPSSTPHTHTRQPLGQPEQPTPAPSLAHPACEGAQLGAGVPAKLKEIPNHPGDSPLTALAVPPTPGSSPCPERVLTGEHSGTGMNPDVTPKRLRCRAWWDTGQHQAWGSRQASRRVPHLRPLPCHLLEPLPSAARFMPPGEEAMLQNLLPA